MGDNILLQFIRKQNKLEDRIFSFVLLVGIVVVAASTVATHMEDISQWATISTAVSGIFLICILINALVFKQMESSRILLCYVLNIFILPIVFFACGGIDSGMPLYLLAGLFAVVPILRGRARVICFVTTLLVDISMIGFSYNFMDGNNAKTHFSFNILATLTLEDRIIDMIVSITLVAIFVCVTTFLILRAYQQERERREELLGRLDVLSKKDELTGLYNRRELFHYLEGVQLFEDRKYYVAMFDIDHFKNVNDTYGHMFGDIALRNVAGELSKAVSDSEGEMAARYGGEEFVLLIKDKSLDTAMERVQKLRSEVEHMKWDEDPDLIITISGGLVECSRYDNLNTVLSSADKLLYEAKNTGRNRIIS